MTRLGEPLGLVLLALQSVGGWSSAFTQRLVCQERARDRSAALRRELQSKRLSRKEKLAPVDVTNWRHGQQEIARVVAG